MTTDFVAASGAGSFETLRALQLQLSKGDAGLAGLESYVRGLLAVGLGEHARYILGKVQWLDPQWMTVQAELLELTHGAPSGLITWTSRRRRFAANLDSLRAFDAPLADAIAAAWEPAAATLQLHQTRDGNVQVFALTAHPLNGWLTGLGDHKTVAQHFSYDRSVPQLVAPAAFDGIGLGWLLLHVLNSTHRSLLSYSCPVYAVEPSLAALAVVLHLHDLREHWPRLRMFGGPTALDDLSAALRTRPQWMLPQMFFANHLVVRAPSAIQETCQLIAAERDQRKQELHERISTWYGDKTVAYWRQRFDDAENGGPPLKVLGVTSRYTTVLRHTMAELGAAVRAAGDDFLLSIEPDDQTCNADLPAAIADYRPDLVVLISRMRHENPELPANVPFLCWDQDALPYMRTEATRKSLDALTYVAGITPLQKYIDRAWPTRNSIFCSLAAATHRYHAGPVGAEIKARYACDFSFVSNASGTPESLRDQAAERHEGAYRSLFFELSQQVIAAGAHQMQCINPIVFKEAEARGLPDDRAVLSNVAADLSTLGDRVTRHVTLGWVARFCREEGKSLKLFGTGWERHATLAEFAAGPIEQGEPLRALYQATRINLQLLMWGFLHARSLDGLAAGGFFMNNWSYHNYVLHAWGDLAMRLGKRALALGVSTTAELDATSDPELHGLWARMSPHISARDRVGEFADLRVGANVLTPDLLFPDFESITFKTREEFAAKAKHFLDDESLRLATMERMRQVVVEECSYDARWRLFKGTISSGLRFYDAQRGDE